MAMECPEEFTGSKDHLRILKGKRTKRPRPWSPSTLAMTSSSSSGGVGCGDGARGDIYPSILSPTTSSEMASTTEEEEDMANCLILLAQSGCPTTKLDKEVVTKKFSSRKFTQTVTTATTEKAGFFVYECQTCNRNFPSFQALGGHRASHKKPKVEEKKANVFPLDKDLYGTTDDHAEGQLDMISPLPISVHIAKVKFQGNNAIKPKVHECSICGAEFSSGQALGGHMRRHRITTITQNNTHTNTSIESSDQAVDRTRNILPLDLNLPAPEDEHEDSKYHIASNRQHLMFSSPTLVDCHY